MLFAQIFSFFLAETSPAVSEVTRFPYLAWDAGLSPGEPVFPLLMAAAFFPPCLREVHIPGKMFKVGFKSWTCRDHWRYLREHLRKPEGSSKSNSLENKLSSWQLLDWFRFLHPERRNKIWTKGPLSDKMCFGRMQVYKGWLYSFSSENFLQDLLFWNGDSWASPEQLWLSHCWDAGLLMTLTSFLPMLIPTGPVTQHQFFLQIASVCVQGFTSFLCEAVDLTALTFITWGFLYT